MLIMLISQFVVQLSNQKFDFLIFFAKKIVDLIVNEIFNF